MGSMPRLLASLGAFLALMAAACSSSTPLEDASTTEPLSPPSSSVAPFSTDSPATTGGQASVVPDLSELWADRGIAVIDVATGSSAGPHPVLSWQAVPSASSYWLVVQDSNGNPYWAWTGSDTEVRFGGGDTDALNQTAVLYEPMSWRIVALAVDGRVVAFSEYAAIEP